MAPDFSEQMRRTANMLQAAMRVSHALPVYLPGGQSEIQELYSIARNCVRKLDLTELVQALLAEKRRCAPGSRRWEPARHAAIGSVVFIWPGGHLEVTAPRLPDQEYLRQVGRQQQQQAAAAAPHLYRTPNNLKQPLSFVLPRSSALT
jgi:hypothetical protein